ncbi:MAG: phosphatidate cytidylyltransferase [Proteobacteria bacterium]|nr:phosphatidate cytidylyltransferase [Pseudomonadota bacterium]MDA0928989.1 phosphatidate cytidylyltransferase [Pseudomonadota bacterium]
MIEGLKQRVATALVLISALAAFTIFLPPFLYAIFIGLLVMAASWEWSGLVEGANSKGRVIYLATVLLMLLGAFGVLQINPVSQQPDVLRAAMILMLGLLWWTLSFLLVKGYPGTSGLWNDNSRIAVMGLLALLPTWVGIVLLKYLDPGGMLVLGLVIMVAAVDVGAYFAGNQFGKRKLAPLLSPNKSWEGVWGGLITCLLIGFLFAWLLNRFLTPLAGWQFAVLLLLPIPVAAFAVLGDLVESMLKRNSQVKDSGQLLPGHGGLLDRVDGLLAATPLFVLTLLFVLFELGE